MDQGIRNREYEEFKNCIMRRKLTMVGYLDLLHTVVIDDLVSRGVISFQQLEELRSFRTNHQVASRFIELMLTKSWEDWEEICRCLERQHHGHVSKIVKEAMTEARRVAAASPQTTGASVQTSMYQTHPAGHGHGEVITPGFQNMNIGQFAARQAPQQGLSGGLGLGGGYMPPSQAGVQSSMYQQSTTGLGGLSSGLGPGGGHMPPSQAGVQPSMYQQSTTGHRDVQHVYHPGYQGVQPASYQQPPTTHGGYPGYTAQQRVPSAQPDEECPTGRGIYAQADASYAGHMSTDRPPHPGNQPEPRQQQHHTQPVPARRRHCYPMEGNPKGEAVIFNFTWVCPMNGDVKPRDGAGVDREKIQNLLNWLGFRVRVLEDLSHQELIRALDEFARDANREETNCVFVVLMSHGGTENNKPYICTKEGVKFYIRDQLEQTFSADKVCHLAKKPKVFIFQACQIDENDPGLFQLEPVAKEAADITVDLPQNQRRTKFDHYLFAFPTQPYRPAFRNTVTGSWFINEIDRVFREHATDMHLADMITMVNNNVSENYRTDTAESQCPEMLVGLKKPLYLR